VNQVVFNMPVRDIRLVFADEPSVDLQKAIAPLLDSLGYPRCAEIDKQLAKDSLKIIVGSK